MGLLDWLLGRTPAVADPPPPIAQTPNALAHNAHRIDVSIELSASHLDYDSDVSTPQGVPVIRHLLEPYFAMIEYTDAQGRTTRRRVTMRCIDEFGGRQILCAYCHERGAVRHFRIDRINCLISQDGEVEDAEAWFAHALEGAETVQAERTFSVGPRITREGPRNARVSPYTALRRNLAPSLTVLIAAARSDDYLHPREVSRILRFAEDESAMLRDAGHLPGNPEADAFDKLERTIRRLRPTREDVSAALNGLGALDLDRRKHLARALAETAAADGRVDDIEAEIIDDLRRLGNRAHGMGWDE